MCLTVGGWKPPLLGLRRITASRWELSHSPVEIPAYEEPSVPDENLASHIRAKESFVATRSSGKTAARRPPARLEGSRATISDNDVGASPPSEAWLFQSIRPFKRDVSHCRRLETAAPWPAAHHCFSMGIIPFTS